MKKKCLYFIAILLLLLLGGCGTGEQDSASIDKQDNQQTEETQDKPEPSSNETDTEQENSEKEAVAEETDTGSGSLPEMQVHFIDVGQADATLFSFGSYKILLDAGDWDNHDVVDYLHSQGISQIDIAIGTHPDADHIGQLDKVINQFEVGEVWMSGNTSTSDTYQRVMEAIDSNQAGYEEPRLGDRYDVGDLQVEVLYPASISGETNQESLAFKMSYGDIDFIFTGDAEKAQEQEMIDSAINLDAEILQLGHHGSDTSTSQTFLEAVSPELAIYSADADNQYGHPHEEVIDRVRNVGAELYGTDAHGTIMVTTDGKSYQVTTHENGEIKAGQSNQQEQTVEKETESTEAGQDTKGQCIDINSAGSEQLQGIIHIGAERAKDVIDLRPFQSIDELTKVSGIGPSRLNDIKGQGIACIGG
ncbi:MBL fold metallo-hydrolase [Sediminibacillus halophilus]|uniref:Metal-dependent hydrolase, beta-lactamase superfamily II n=1 Tax=Sediminibacillus halophilus TaxID=482461 RepID=A0A1G9NP17_9BACI|nr:MBL fold metallo-hydrolase [Sediminibacillus halophilus]SDL88332.1 Metal-dependent hydrolase, beta-lactamase superfamily II [Sediminibacillus halophilus]